MLDVLEHPKAWWEGYISNALESENPYAIGQPWLSEFPNKEILANCKSWQEGREAREFGYM